MRILIGIAIGVFGVYAYQDPSIIEPAKEHVMNALNWVGQIVVDKTGK